MAYLPYGLLQGDVKTLRVARAHFLLHPWTSSEDTYLRKSLSLSSLESKISATPPGQIPMLQPSFILRMAFLLPAPWHPIQVITCRITGNLPGQRDTSIYTRNQLEKYVVVENKVRI